MRSATGRCASALLVLLLAAAFSRSTPPSLARQGERHELVINLKAAKAFGLTIPPSVLVRANELIEK